MKKTRNIRTAVSALVVGISLGIVPGTIEKADAAESRVGAGWSKKAQDRRGGVNQMKSAIRQGFGRAKAQHRNSKTNATLRLRFLNLFPNYNDSGKSLLNNFNDWKSRRVGKTNTGKTQERWENDGKLDLPAFFAVGGGSRGWGQRPGAYSTITEGQTTVHTLGHELGHNFDGIHGSGNAMQPSDKNDLPGTRYTSLASGGRSNSQVVDYYSNPNVKYRRARTGSTAKNNAGRIRNRQVKTSKRK